MFINISGTNFTGTMNGTSNASGASGTITANLNSGVQMYSISRGGSTIGFVLMDTSTGTFNGYDQGNSISGYIDAEGTGAITLGTGEYYAAMTGSGVFGTIDISHSRYAIGGSSANFFMVNSGGTKFATGSLSSVPMNDPGWTTYLVNNRLPHPPGFSGLLSLSNGNGLFYACTPLSNGARCHRGGQTYTDITSP